MRIRIEKIAEVQGGLPANNRKLHVDGQVQDENYSLPIDYTIEGDLMGTISVGHSIVVNRDTRNGVKMPGFFTTSVVQSIDGETVHTRNSVYKYKFLEV